MRIQRIHDLDDPAVQAYRNVREADLKGRDELFIAEGRLVVGLLLKGGRFRAESVLVTEPAFNAIRPVLESVAEPPPVLLADPGVMNAIVGFDIHRGCLAAGRRGPVPMAHDLLTGEGADARLIIAVEDLSNHDNLGGIFRSAAAFGIGAVLLTPRCCDPLYRKAIRVSMGHVLRVPYGQMEPGRAGIESLREMGIFTVALTPHPDAVSLAELSRRFAETEPGRVCLVLGSEGEGLSPGMIEGADLRVRIPMAPGVDSLNASVAGAIATQRIAEAMGLR